MQDAQKVIEKSLREYPVETAPYHEGNIDFVRLMWMAGMKDEANRYFELLTNIHLHNLRFFAAQNDRFLSLISYDVREEMDFEKKLRKAMDDCEQKDMLNRLDSFYKK